MRLDMTYRESRMRSSRMSLAVSSYRRFNFFSPMEVSCRWPEEWDDIEFKRGYREGALKSRVSSRKIDLPGQRRGRFFIGSDDNTIMIDELQEGREEEARTPTEIVLEEEVQ
ncbi:hypothetical protein HMI54_014167 [Coelomomyces lativittatus]|nr:hypothetical protein HMI54_014167 [Coelomomyces lativittatus]KAJ1511743.1 hypothetical protein HMI56_005013 [Coelomomyces lativittatus]